MPLKSFGTRLDAVWDICRFCALILKVRRTSGAVCAENPLPRKPTWRLTWSFIREPRTSSVTDVTRRSTGNRILSSTCIHTRCKDVIALLLSDLTKISIFSFINKPCLFCFLQRASDHLPKVRQAVPENRPLEEAPQLP